MAMGKRPQGNPWVAAGGIFIVLFLIATVVAVVLYLNLEKQLKANAEMQTQHNELIDARQWANRGSLIGTKPPRQNYVDLLLGYVDDMAYFILGAPREETSAEVKAQNINTKVSEIALALSNDYPDITVVDVNTMGLIGTINRLKNKLDTSNVSVQSLENQIEELQQKFDDAVKAISQKEQELLDEKSRLTAKTNEVQRSFDALKALMEQKTEDQVKMLWVDLEKEREKNEELSQNLLRARAELNVASETLKQAREQLRQIVGSPDMEVAARVPDGEVMLLDEYSKTVHINLGSQDRVYPGLTFAVYNRNVPIPRDGVGKGEIEVFNVAKNISTARIVRSDPKNPILVGDIIANLVWDSKQTNLFVVAGDFDLDGDGTMDYQAVEKIKALIEGWGGKIETAVSVNTSFVVLGEPPAVLPRPTYDQIAIDPMAMEKHEASLKKLDHYKQVRQQAETLAIPILNFDRFLYLIGYKTQSGQPGAFGG
ncbi:MAG: hypothetical protein WCZ89_04630 [Phycisphaerae bacterium]